MLNSQSEKAKKEIEAPSLAEGLETDLQAVLGIEASIIGLRLKLIYKININEKDYFNRIF